MSLATVVIAMFLAGACIAAAMTMMRRFEAAEATQGQSPASADRPLAQINQEVKIRRVRAGAPGNTHCDCCQHFGFSLPVGVVGQISYKTRCECLRADGTRTTTRPEHGCAYWEVRAGTPTHTTLTRMEE
ncbi:MAG: hypothetical protein ACOYNZ_02180 [Rhodoferax sp.]